MRFFILSRVSPASARLTRHLLNNKRLRPSDVDGLSEAGTAHRITIAPLVRKPSILPPLRVLPVSHRPACDKCYGSARAGLKVAPGSGSARAFASELAM